MSSEASSQTPIWMKGPEPAILPPLASGRLERVGVRPRACVTSAGYREGSRGRLGLSRGPRTLRHACTTPFGPIGLSVVGRHAAATRARAAVRWKARSRGRPDAASLAREPALATNPSVSYGPIPATARPRLRREPAALAWPQARPAEARPPPQPTMRRGLRACLAQPAPVGRYARHARTYSARRDR